MTKTILERGQAVANSLYGLEAQIAALGLPADHPLMGAKENHHDKLNKLRLAFGIDLVEPENLRSGVIAFSGGGSKNPPPPPGGL